MWGLSEIHIIVWHSDYIISTKVLDRSNGFLCPNNPWFGECMKFLPCLSVCLSVILWQKTLTFSYLTYMFLLKRSFYWYQRPSVHHKACPVCNQSSKLTFKVRLQVLAAWPKVRQQNTSLGSKKSKFERLRDYKPRPKSPFSFNKSIVVSIRRF